MENKKVNVITDTPDKDLFNAPASCSDLSHLLPYLGADALKALSSLDELEKALETKLTGMGMDAKPE